MKKRPYHLYLKCTLLVSLMLCAFCLCGYRLMKIQLVDSETYVSRKYSTYKYKQTIDATRGEIVDCNGDPIVVNKVGYSVVILPEQFPKDMAEGNEILLTITNMLAQCGVSPELSIPVSDEAPYTFTTDDEDVLERFKSNLGLNVYATPANCMDKIIEDYEISPEYSEEQKRLLCGLRYEMLCRGFSMSRRFTLAEDIPLSSITEIKESGINLPGIEIMEMPLREIVRDNVLPHEIGTVGPIYAEEYEELSAKGYDMDDTVGKSGIEKACESYLRGNDGIKTISIQNNEIISSEMTTPVESGKTVMLTVDSQFQLDLQKTLEDFINNFDSLRNKKTEELKLGKVTNGAVVVLDAKTSGVLGMATCPTYDLTTYLEDYESLLTAENNPLVNRATRGLYRPGSTFKPITATAGLSEGIISGYSTFFCGKQYLFHDHKYNCTGGHGNISLIPALQYSCNIYFYKLAENLTIDGITKYSELYGLGQPTGLETGGAAGHLSNPEYYAEADLPWTVGEVLQSAIGQSEWAVTPLQMAVVANTIANNGVRYEPHLVDSIWDYNMENKIEDKKPVKAATIPGSENGIFEFIKQGMVAASVTNMPTEYSLGNLGYSVAIKTGTPQQGSRVQDSFFIGFAPADDPEIAFAGVIEGGEYSKYMIRSIIEAYEDYKERQASTG
ncbi:MAG: peptidoglycan D,D-transpeptidase FtsI family protein [Ruminococcus sp.]